MAVLGCGFRYTYPPENTALFESIAAAGALVSEFPMSAPPLGENFPRRNRLIAALAAATVVVEATEKSGALHTASYALEQGREVMAVPGPITSPQSRGCHSLIQQGAKLVRDAADVVDELSPMYKAALREPGPRPPRIPMGPWTRSNRMRWPFYDFSTILGRSTSTIWPTRPPSGSRACKPPFSPWFCVGRLISFRVGTMLPALERGRSSHKGRKARAHGAFPGHRRIARQGEDDQQVPGEGLRREGLDGTRARPSQAHAGGRREGLHADLHRPPRKEEDTRRAEEGGQGGRHDLPRRRPRSRGRGDLLAPQGRAARRTPRRRSAA